MVDSQKTVRIFISSPGDVSEERDGARQVVEGLRRLYPSANLETVLWEELALPATASFQETIDLLLERERIDIAVFILWSRLGSPLGPSITRSDGTPYRSGTEREFDLMLTAFEQSGCKRPMILVYVREDYEGFTRKLSEVPKSELIEVVDQRKLAEDFIVEQFHDVEGRNLRAYQTYREPIGFAQRLRVHLRSALDDLLEVDSVTWTEDPYRGLETFEIEHAPIFYGREEETCDLLQRLRDQQQAGCGFVVMVGASGSGKSSLARAGLAATLVQQASDDDARWRVVNFIPALADQGLCHTLVNSLGQIFPDLVASPATADRIAHGLAENATLATDLSIKPAFERSKDPIQVLLIIDQMEELWTDQHTTEKERESFLASVEALAHCGHVCVLATLRSDFYHHAQSSPAFLRLKGERGHFDLTAPRAASIHRLITEPARLSGLRFELSDTTKRSLDETILEDALGNADALPLLEYTLSELYRRRHEERRLLTYAAYIELGGVEGAIGKRAEEIFGSLPADAQAALNELLPHLVSVDVAGEQTSVRRSVPVTDLVSTPARTMLTETLIKNRFLITDREGETPVASLAHEALLRSWDRIVVWINNNREHLRLRARIEQLQELWEQQGRDSSLLLAEGLPLDEGRELLERAPYLLAHVTTVYIQDSIVKQERLQGHAAMEALLGADPQSVLNAAKVTTAYRLSTEDELQRIAAVDTKNRKEQRRQRHARLGLIAFDSSHIGSLLDDALTNDDTEYLGVIREALLKAGASIEEDCWSRFRNGELPNQERFRAGVMLAGVAPESDQWTDADFQLLVDELAALNSLYQPQFWPLLRNVGDRMLPPLEAMFGDRERPASEQLAAANAIAFFAEQDVQRLARLLLIATGPQYKILYAKYREVADEQTLADLAASVKQQPTDDLDPDVRIALGKERATSAITLLRQGERESIFDVLRYEDDPEALTQFVHRCRARGVTPSELIDLFELIDQRRGPLDGGRQKTDGSVMYALLLSLGEFAWDDLPPNRETFVERLGAIYETDPSSGVHSATGWLLRLWNQRVTVDRVDQTRLEFDPTGHREWYVSEIESVARGVFAPRSVIHLTFVVFQPGEFTMGSPDNEPSRSSAETQHEVTLNRPIAICDRELTWAQWEASENPRATRYTYMQRLSRVLSDNDPAFGFNWWGAVEYCRWLSTLAGISEDKQCYDEPSSLTHDEQGNVTDWPMRPEGTGFRLPTEAEWEFVCRSGTGTAYSFGHDVNLLGHYAWFKGNSADWLHGTAELRPNPRGLFDIHGNLMEWCHDWYTHEWFTHNGDLLDAVTAGECRVFRGGSWDDPAKACRSSQRLWGPPEYRQPTLGLRLATVPSSQESVSEEPANAGGIAES